MAVQTIAKRNGKWLVVNPQIIRWRRKMARIRSNSPVVKK